MKRPSISQPNSTCSVKIKSWNHNNLELNDWSSFQCLSASSFAIAIFFGPIFAEELFLLVPEYSILYFGSFRKLQLWKKASTAPLVHSTKCIMYSRIHNFVDRYLLCNTFSFISTVEFRKYATRRINCMQCSIVPTHFYFISNSQFFSPSFVAIYLMDGFTGSNWPWSNFNYKQSAAASENRKYHFVIFFWVFMFLQQYCFSF